MLFFNTVENKSHLWGVEAWHFYFSSALPRAMGPAIARLPIGCLALAQPARAGCSASLLARVAQRTCRA